MKQIESFVKEFAVETWRNASLTDSFKAKAPDTSPSDLLETRKIDRLSAGARGNNCDQWSIPPN